jgi:ribosome biogenesis GTPase A
MAVDDMALTDFHCRECWAEYFRSENVTFAFCSAMEDQIRQKNELEQENQAPVNAHPDDEDSEEEEELKRDHADEVEPEVHPSDEDAEDEDDIDLSTYNGTEVLSTKQLLKLFRKLYFSDSEDKENSEEAITVGMVGYPNVGKSSMVNVSKMIVLSDLNLKELFFVGSLWREEGWSCSHAWKDKTFSNHCAWKRHLM